MRAPYRSVANSRVEHIMRLQNEFSGVLSLGAPTALKRLVADILDLAPDIVARAAEIEAARRIPPDLVETLKSIGVFRMFVPRSHGGLELDLPNGLKVISTLSRIDASVGWTTAIGCGGTLMTALLPRETYDQVYQDGPDMVMAGSIAPAGTAEETVGGWRVSGRWPFASGCQHAAWMMGQCIMTRDGKPLPGPMGEAGPPLVRAVIMPASDWRIEDTWYAAGLKGTGSHHIALKDTVVPAAHLIDLMNGVACLPGPLYQAPRHMLPMLHGAVSLGIAEGAVDDIVALANTGRQQLRAAVPMRNSEMFQGELGRAAADLRAAQAFLEVQAASHWRHAIAGTLKGEALHIQGTQAAIWLVTTCVRIADACFMLGGGSAVYEGSPLPRRMRDLHAAAQHAVAQQRNYPSAGLLLLDGSAAGSEDRSEHRARSATPIH